mmetsp:Transcript_9267/g.12609  ORF Transcript_9267/g.12609 Transcript_9267/m.12609 type:complete len:150 (+) Transcript_9267:25-474(+)
MKLAAAITALLVGTATAGSFKDVVVDSELKKLGTLELTLIPELMASTHYGNPSDGGCMDDEQAVRISGVAGAVCSPTCNQGACPSDVPSGCEATPQCMLQDASSGKKYCALRCNKSTNCGPGAECQMIVGPIGICTYTGEQALGDVIAL